MKIKKVEAEELEIAELKDLTQDPKNARKHNPRNIGMIEDSLRKVGAARSGVIDENGVILAGNGTYEALVAAGIERVKIVEANGAEWVVVQRHGLTESQKRILSISDNRASDLADWDPVMLQAQDIDLAPWFFPEELKEIEIPSQEGTEPQEAKSFDGPVIIKVFKHGLLMQEIDLPTREWSGTIEKK